MPFAAIGYTLGAVQPESHPDVFLLIKSDPVYGFRPNFCDGIQIRWTDRKIDAKNLRTKQREIPAGTISPSAALSLVIISSGLFILTTWFINPILFFLSPVALLVVLGYSYTKDLLGFVIWYQGIDYHSPPIGAYLAVTGRFDILPLLFSFTVITWVKGIWYYLCSAGWQSLTKANNSIPFLHSLGGKRFGFSGILHFISIFCVLFAGKTGSFGYDLLDRRCFFAGLVIYQHTLIRPDDLSKVNIAFLQPTE